MSVTVNAPIAPSAYSLPGTYVEVSTAAQLITALANGTKTNIVLDDGTYDNSVPFDNTSAWHNLYSKNLLGAVLTAGISCGANWAGASPAQIQGIHFNVSSLAKCSGDGNTSIFELWGDGGIGTTFLDCYFDGNMVCLRGILACPQCMGLVCQRLVFRNFVDTGLYASDNGVGVSVINTITDIDSANCYSTPRGSMNGTGEFCIWIGNKVTNTVARLKARNYGWGGIWTGGANYHTSMTDIDADNDPAFPDDGTPFYCEQGTRFLDVGNFKFGPHLYDAIAGEWDSGLAVGLSGSTQLPLATIAVNEDTGSFNSSGLIYIGNPDGSIDCVAYTGKTSSSFTGCSVLPVFRAAGAKSAGTTGAVTVAAPSGIAQSDLEILIATTIAGGSITITDIGGDTPWTALSCSPQDVTSGEKLYIWWRIRGSDDGDPIITPGSDHSCACRLAYKAGTFSAVSPIEIATASTETTSDTSFSYAPGTSTTLANELVLCVATSGQDSNTAQVPVCTNSSLTSLASRANYETSNGGGGGFGVTQGTRATAGTVGTFACTYVTASTKAYMAFAIKPPNNLHSAGEIVSDESGGVASWKINFHDGFIDPSVRTDYIYAIMDRSNNPACTGAANSNLTTSGNSYGSLIGIGYYGEGNEDESFIYLDDGTMFPTIENVTFAPYSSGGTSSIGKVSGVAYASIGKVSGVTITSIEKIAGLE